MYTPRNKWAPWALAAATVLLAVLLMIGCLSIYLSGSGFSRELVWEKLADLSWAFLLWLAALIFALVPGPAAPGKAPKPQKMDKTRGGSLPPFLLPGLYGLSLVLILWGTFNGGAWDVLVKAINICTECIGLG